MSEQAPITGSFIWTLEDARERQTILLKTQKQNYIPIVFVLTLVTIISMIYYRTSIHSFFDLLLYALPLFTILFIPFFVRYNQKSNLKRAFSQSLDSNKRIDVILTHKEITMKTEGIYEDKWKWNTIKEVRRNSQGFCFLLTEQAGFWVPIRAFQSEAEAHSIVELVKHLMQEIPSLKYRETT